MDMHIYATLHMGCIRACALCYFTHVLRTKGNGEGRAELPAAQCNNLVVLHLLTPQAPRLLQSLRQELYIEMPE